MNKRKRYVFVCCCIMAALVLAAAYRQTMGFRLGKALPKEYEDEINIRGISMVITECFPEGASFLMVNEGEKDGFYGTPYSLQVERGGRWYTLNYQPARWGQEIDWTMPAFNLDAGAQREEHQNWSWLYGALPPGHYRLFKWVSFGRGGNMTYVGAAGEFVIPSE